MNKTRVGLMLAFCVSGWLALFGDKSSVDATAIALPARASMERSASSEAAVEARKGDRRSSDEAPVALERLLPREQLVHPRTASGAARNPFIATSWTQAPVAPPPAVSAPPPSPVPTVPPLPYTMLGKKTEAGAWEVYLGRADQVFVATVGSTIEGLYRVDRIQPPDMQLTYLPLGRPQSLSIGEDSR